MDLIHLQTELEKRLPVKRYDHVMRVVDTAKQLANIHGLSEKKAELAALFHDIAKAMDKTELLHLLKEAQPDPRLFSFHHELWHAPVGALIASKDFGIDDEDLLNAIRSHTTGRAGMSQLEKLIYVSDMIEPGRVFPGVDQLREAARCDLDTAMTECIVHSIKHLVEKRVAIYPDSIDCYNDNLHITTQIRREQ